VNNISSTPVLPHSSDSPTPVLPHSSDSPTEEEIISNPPPKNGDKIDTELHIYAHDSLTPPVGSREYGVGKRNRILLSETKVSDEVISLTEKLKTLILQNDPKAKIPDNLINWQKEIDKLIRLDKREYAEIDKVIAWCQNDNFWKTVVLSADKLRKKFPQLFLQMNNNGNVKNNGHGNGNGNNGGGLKISPEYQSNLLKQVEELESSEGLRNN
jgi:hypothetical protein